MEKSFKNLTKEFATRKKKVKKFDGKVNIDDLKYA